MNMLSKKNKIYYWANSTSKNDGEGILANNYLILLKRNFKNHSLINLNKYKNSESFVFKYILPFYGVILLWKYNLQNKKISYINYLPVWNFLLPLLLPSTTILGPVTGSINRKNLNFLVKIFSIIGIKILLYKYYQRCFFRIFSTCLTSFILVSTDCLPNFKGFPSFVMKWSCSKALSVASIHSVPFNLRKT